MAACEITWQLFFYLIIQDGGLVSARGSYFFLIIQDGGLVRARGSFFLSDYSMVG